MLTKFIIMLNIREKKNYFLHKGYQITRDPQVGQIVASPPEYLKTTHLIIGILTTL